MKARYDVGQALSMLIYRDLVNVEFHNNCYSVACSEVWWILQNIPQTILEKIPIETLMAIKNNADIMHPIDFSMTGDNHYRSDTVEIFSYLVAKFIPDFDELLEKYRKQIPEDFNLNDLFED